MKAKLTQRHDAALVADKELMLGKVSSSLYNCFSSTQIPRILEKCREDR